MWYRVFGLSNKDVQPGALLEHLQNHQSPITGHFRGDEEGWFEAELACGDYPFRLQKYLITEEGIRAELNSWAAWVEFQEVPMKLDLLERIINTQQLFTMELPDADKSAVPLQDFCARVTRFLAEQTQGLYQIDEQGIFDADGTLLIQEIPEENRISPDNE